MILQKLKATTLRQRLLAALVAVLVATPSTLYYKGYWDTWEDKRPDIKAYFDKQFAEMSKEDYPGKEVEDKFTACMVDALMETVVKLECPLDGMDDTMQQLKDCVGANPQAGMLLQIRMMVCAMSAQTETEQEESPQ